LRRDASPVVLPYSVAKSLTTDKCGVLEMGDEFEFQVNDVEGANWKVFTFRGHLTPTGNGPEHVNCVGGDPVPTGDPAWRAFDVDRVRATARPVRANWRSKRA
jgi:hypothetical protein